MENVVLSTHTHDDLGMAVANTLAGIRGGARQVECTINGIGERAGNAALEEVAMAIHVRHDVLPVFTDIHSEELYASSQMLTRLTGMAVQRNKAIVGRNAFAHEAGIHQDGVLKNAITYEIITPQTVGMPSNFIVLGKHSGRHALAKRYEDLGYQLTRPELERAYTLFTQLADRKKNIYDEDLLAIVDEGFSHFPETYSLKLFQSVSSHEGRATATLELERTRRPSTILPPATGRAMPPSAPSTALRGYRVRSPILPYTPRVLVPTAGQKFASGCVLTGGSFRENAQVTTSLRPPRVPTCRQPTKPPTR